MSVNGYHVERFRNKLYSISSVEPCRTLTAGIAAVAGSGLPTVLEVAPTEPETAVKRFLVYATRHGHLFYDENMVVFVNESWTPMWKTEDFSETFLMVMLLGLPSVRLIELLDLSVEDLDRAQLEFRAFYTLIIDDLIRVTDVRIGGL